MKKILVILFMFVVIITACSSNVSSKDAMEVVKTNFTEKNVNYTSKEVAEYKAGDNSDLIGKVEYTFKYDV